MPKIYLLFMHFITKLPSLFCMFVPFCSVCVLIYCIAEMKLSFLKVDENDSNETNKKSTNNACDLEFFPTSISALNRLYLNFNAKLWSNRNYFNYIWRSDTNVSFSEKSFTTISLIISKEVNKIAHQIRRIYIYCRFQLFLEAHL